jgi:hypothetical protein
MDSLVPALIGALVGGSITIAGWFANYRFARKRDEENCRREGTLRHLERQIEELYGPLWGLVQQSEAIHDVLCQIVPTDAEHRIDHSKFTQRDAQVMNYFKDRFFLPINSQIAELLRSKVYLLESSNIPDSFKSVISHQAQFESLHHLWKDEGVSNLGTVIGTGWPRQFNSDVAITLQELRKRYQGNLKQTGRV